MQQMVQISSLAMGLKDLTFAGMTSVLVSCFVGRDTDGLVQSVPTFFFFFCPNLVILNSRGFGHMFDRESLFTRVRGVKDTHAHNKRQMTKAVKIG